MSEFVLSHILHWIDYVNVRFFFCHRITDLKKFEYRTVRVRGEFLHDIEMFLGPRSLNVAGSQTQGGLITKQDSGMGFQVVTPFKVENSE